MIKKTAAVGIKARAMEELLKTEALRNSTVKHIKDNGLISGGLNFLANHKIPGAAGLNSLSDSLHAGILKADTYLGSILRGNAAPGSFRYRLFTNSKGMVQNKNNTFTKVDRASAIKPVNYVASAAVVPAAVIGLESLKDPDPETIMNTGGTVL